MAYAEPTNNRVVETLAISDDRDRIRWGPIIAGIFVAIATQLILSALGAAIGLTIGAGGSDPNAVGIGVGIWAIISLLIALFIGSWVTTSGCSPMNKKTAMLHGVIFWATTLAISGWLLASGVSGAFGIAASNAGEALNQAQQPGGVRIPNQLPNVTPQQLQQAAGNSAKAAWSFIIGSLLGLAASLIGATVGAKKPRPVRTGRIPEPQAPENLAR
jgi:ABC-type transport system involved in multi-copper enzyme maturation permease subunit